MFDNAEQWLRVDRLESSLGTLQARLNEPQPCAGMAAASASPISMQ
jgi:hypothetical protein